MVKAQVLQILHQIGVSDDVALKTVNLFSDVQDTYIKSKETMKEHFDSIVNKSNTETIEVDEENGTSTV